MGGEGEREAEVGAVRRIYAAFARWDIDEMLTDVTHDFEMVIPDAVPFGGTHHGADAIRTFARLYTEHYDGSFADPDEFLDAEDRLVVLGRLRGRGKETGRGYEVPFAHVWTFDEGMPSRLRSYFDSTPMLEVLAG